MDIRLLTTAPELAAYDAWVSAHAEGSLWQSLAWKRFQEARKREVRVYAAMEGDRIVASALVVIDRTAGGYSTWDIPRGPLAEDRGQRTGSGELLHHIVADAKADRCFALYLSPLSALPSDFRLLTSDSPRHEQPEATRIVDLTLTEEDLLKQMHQKGRYNIKVAEKNGVRVELSQDVAAYATLARETAKRDGFTVPSQAHFEAFLRTVEGSFLLLAYAGTLETHPSPIAGLIGVVWETTGIYYYGASSYEHRALMAPYLLQWEAMKHCKAQGCERYDLLGVAPPGAPENHPWQGISGFKEKFGGETVTYPPERQTILRPLVYALLRLKRRLAG